MTTNHTSIKQEFLSELLKCPRCQHYMMSNIYQCSKGHSVCANCCKTYVRCRICRYSVNMKIRNYSLETVAALIKLHSPSAETEAHIKQCKKAIGTLQKNKRSRGRCVDQ